MNLVMHIPQQALDGGSLQMQSTLAMLSLLGTVEDQYTL